MSTPSDETTPPALTADEWARVTSKRTVPVASVLDAEASDGRVELWREGNYEGCSGHIDTVERPAALAALCLYGQSYGFTQEDVALIREAAASIANDYRVLKPGREEELTYTNRIANVADRIAALLPPSETGS